MCYIKNLLRDTVQALLQTVPIRLCMCLHVHVYTAMQILVIFICMLACTRIYADLGNIYLYLFNY